MKGLACFGTTSAMSIVAGLCMSAATDNAGGSGSRTISGDGKPKGSDGKPKKDSFGHDIDSNTTGGGHSGSKRNGNSAS